MLLSNPRLLQSLAMAQSQQSPQPTEEEDMDAKLKAGQNAVDSSNAFLASLVSRQEQKDLLNRAAANPEMGPVSGPFFSFNPAMPQPEMPSWGTHMKPYGDPSMMSQTKQAGSGILRFILGLMERANNSRFARSML
jgi:hypothetical protein